MAYVSKVNVEGTVYDVKDELAVHEDSFNNAFIAALGDVVVKNSLLSMFYPIGTLSWGRHKKEVCMGMLLQVRVKVLEITHMV